MILVSIQAGNMTDPHTALATITRYRRLVNKRTLSTSTLKYLPLRYLLRLVKDQGKHHSFFATFK